MDTEISRGPACHPLSALLAVTLLAGVLPWTTTAAAPPAHKYSGSSTDTPEIGTGPDALRQIVQEKCVINWLQHQDPSPCERVNLVDPKSGKAGYAVLADRKGGAHYLLIPTQTMTGIDAGELLDPDTPNYFAEAWHARGVLTRFVGHAVPRTAVGLAVNTAHARSQTQFHIHIECLRQDVAASLQAATQSLTEAWSPIDVAGSTYHAMKIPGNELDGANPYELVARLSPDARRHIGDYTVVIAGMQYPAGPGFVVLTGTGPTGELLLDSSCAIAGAGG